MRDRLVSCTEHTVWDYSTERESMLTANIGLFLYLVSKWEQSFEMHFIVWITIVNEVPCLFFIILWGLAIYCFCVETSCTFIYFLPQLMCGVLKIASFIYVKPKAVHEWSTSQALKWKEERTGCSTAVDQRVALQFFSPTPPFCSNMVIPQNFLRTS